MTEEDAEARARRELRDSAEAYLAHHPLGRPAELILELLAEIRRLEGRAPGSSGSKRARSLVRGDVVGPTVVLVGALPSSAFPPGFVEWKARSRTSGTISVYCAPADALIALGTE